MGRRSINTTKSGKYMNPTDQFRKEARKRELKKNKKQRIMVRTAVLRGKDPMKLLEEMEVIDRMEYDPMQPPSLNEKVLREKRKKLKETFDRVFKLYEKDRPDYAVDLKKASIEYEKTRSQLQQHYDQVRNAERVQLDQIPLPDAPVEMGIPGVIPLPMDIPILIPGMPMPMTAMPPPSILKKTSAYGPPVGIGPQIPIHIQSQKKKKPAGPPPGPPPELSDSEEEEEEEPEREREHVDEEYDPEKGIIDDLGNVDVDMDEEEAMRRESLGKSRKIRFADDDEEDEDARLSDDERRREREERRRRRRERKQKKQEEKEKSKKKGVSALQAMMLQMAGQHVPEYEKDGESSSSESSGSSQQSSESDDEDRRGRRYAERREEERIRSKDREIARRREEISRLDDRPPGVDDHGDRLSEPETAAMVAARLAEEAELEAENRQLSTGPTKIPPGPPPGLPPNMGGPQGMPPGPPPGAPPMFMRPPPMRGGPPGAPPRLMPPGPPPGRPQGMPPGPPPGLPPNLRSSLMRIPTPMGVPPPRGMMRPPGGPPGLHPQSIPPPQGMNPNILSAPPSIRPRDGEEGSGPPGPGGPSRVTIQAKPQIKSKMGDVTRFMPMSLKVKRETRDQKGRIRQNKEEEPRVIGAPAKPQPAPAAQAKTKDDAYDQFMKEMEGLI